MKPHLDSTIANATSSSIAELNTLLPAKDIYFANVVIDISSVFNIVTERTLDIMASAFGGLNKLLEIAFLISDAKTIDIAKYELFDYIVSTGMNVDLLKEVLMQLAYASTPVLNTMYSKSVQSTTQVVDAIVDYRYHQDYQYHEGVIYARVRYSLR